MITGYNTDVRHGGIVFHVQTEDTGRTNPSIESMIYVGGRVLAAKRSSYGHLLEQGKGTEEIAELMEQQHKLMIAAVRRGLYDADVRALTASGDLQDDAAMSPAREPQPEESRREAAAEEIPSGKPEEAKVTAPPGDSSLDQVILDYLAAEAEQEQLVLEMETAGELGLARETKTAFIARSSKSGDPVAGVQVDVNLISTIAEAASLASGKTDAEGSLRLTIRVPDLQSGTAALIITATGDFGQAEIKQLL